MSRGAGDNRSEEDDEGNCDGSVGAYNLTEHLWRL
jgi:hypothetical protein